MKKGDPMYPPKFAEAFLAWFCNEDLLEEIRGDLCEIYIEEMELKGRFKASVLYHLRVLSFIKLRNIKPTKPGNFMMLFRNYLLVAYRNLVKYKGYSTFNLLGLTTGLIASILMVVYVLDELSYDRQFSQHDKIYRVAQHVYMETGEMTGALTPDPLGAALKKEFPEIKDYASCNMYNRLTFNVDGEKFTDPDSHPVSSSFLKVFDYPFLVGDPETALSQPNSMVISKSRALSYFGSLDILGRTVETDHHGTFTITGIMEDPYKSAHFHHQILFYINDDHFNGNLWDENGCYTYVLLNDGTALEGVTKKLPDFYEKHLAQPVKEAFSGSGYLFLQKLTDIHLFSDISFEMEPNNKFYHVLGIGLLAGFIMLVVCINYMNMATAQATRRVREVGIRKALGSNRKMLLVQFFTESALITIASAVIALLLVPVFLPYFNYLTDKQFLSADFLRGDIIGICFIIVLLTGIIGGSYPAIFLSRFNADAILKKSYSLGRFNLPLSKILSGVQFAVGLSMIIITFSIYRQLEFARNMDLGFDQKNVIKINLKNRMNDEYPLVQTLLVHPEIEAVAASKQAPGDDIQLEGFSFELSDGSFGVYKAEFNAVDKNYLSVLNMDLVAGRNIGDERPGTVAIINETLVRKLGYLKPESALEKRVRLPIGENFYARIIGVTRDTHTRSVHHEIAPHILINFTPITTMLLVKTKTRDMKQLLGFIEDKTSEITNSSSHIVTFLDQDYWKQYQEEEKRSKILSIFSSLIVSLAFAGLIGLVSFHIRVKAKEISIRKVFGAKFGNILLIYVCQYSWQILLSVALAIPATIYFIDQWLESFAYQIRLPYDLLAVASFLLISMVFLVIVLQSWKSFRLSSTCFLKED